MKNYLLSALLLLSTGFIFADGHSSAEKEVISKISEWVPHPRLLLIPMRRKLSSKHCLRRGVLVVGMRIPANIRKPTGLPTRQNPNAPWGQSGSARVKQILTKRTSKPDKK